MNTKKRLSEITGNRFFVLCENICLFHFLKVNIRYTAILLVVAGVATSLLTEVRTRLCATLGVLGIVHFLACCLEYAVQFCHSCIDTSNVLSLVSFFQRLGEEEIRKTAESYLAAG